MPDASPRSSYQNLQAYTFLAPALVLLLALLVYPLGQVVRMSFFDVTPRAERWVGLENYRLLVQNPAFWDAFLHTVWFTLGTVGLHLVIGMGLALLLHSRIDTRVRNVFRGLLIVPWLFAPTVAAMIWVLILNPFGVLNGFLAALGILGAAETINWLGNPGTSLLAVTAVNVWRAFPFAMVMLLAGLQAIPDELYEAAAIDGSGPLQKFRFVTLPSLRGVILTMALLDFIWTFRAFDLVYVMTGGGPVDSSQVLATSIYFDAFQKFRFGYASAEAIAMLVILLAGSIVYVRRATQE
jgi:multiple sugar transport system permease protein